MTAWVVRVTSKTPKEISSIALLVFPRLSIHWDTRLRPGAKSCKFNPRGFLIKKIIYESSLEVFLLSKIVFLYYFLKKREFSLKGGGVLTLKAARYEHYPVSQSHKSEKIHGFF